VKGDRVPRAVGTYGIRDVLRGRRVGPTLRDFLLRRPLVPELPGRAASQADVEALGRGESRVVACHLRATFGPYPRRLTHGSLLVSARSATWTPYLRFPWRSALNMDLEVPWVRTRRPGLRDLNVDRRQKVCDGVMVSRWMFVTARYPAGSIDFVVPFPDVPLITAWLCRTAAPPHPARELSRDGSDAFGTTIRESPLRYR
jgi:hypothetical protein